MNWLYLRKTTLFLAFILHVSADAQGHDPKCPLLKVQRGTLHKAFTNKTFKISCNLMYCDDQTINVTWTKATLDKWTPVSEADQMSTSQRYSSTDPKTLTSYLTFTNISKHHEGSYRCEVMLPHLSMHSHHINVFVSDNILEDEMTIERDITDSSSGSYPWWLPYLFICLGAVILVVVVMLILILCINAFKNSRRKNAQRAQVQYTDLLKRDEYVCVQYSEEIMWPYHDHTSG